MTDLSASNDVIIITHHHIFKDTLRNQTQNFLILKIQSLICLQTINSCYTAKYSTQTVKVIPRELQSISRLATHAD